MTPSPPADRLPPFPWDRLAPFAARAVEHPGGVVDLSVGTPVDPTPALIRRALADAADAPGYPTTHGTTAVRRAAVGWMERRLGVTGVDPASVLPAVGTKELVAWLPTLLGLGRGSRVVIPELAYPTYAVGARLCGAEPVVTDALTAVGPAPVDLVWLNSPSNPTGKVLPVEHLRKVVEWARERGALVVSDECYIELGWTERPVSVLHPDVCGGSTHGVIALHSLSKRSNLAGYRFGFAAGDPVVVAELLEVRKHVGMMVPAPVQAAAVAALDDDTHVEEQRARYARRREALAQALISAGFTVEHSQAGLYLWVTRGEPCWDTVAALAAVGVLVAPGDFYGPAGAQHVRVALTATDERVEAAVERLAALPPVGPSGARR
jgi:succinyldiaminopimelate transaminase